MSARHGTSAWPGSAERLVETRLTSIGRPARQRSTGSLLRMLLVLGLLFVVLPIVEIYFIIQVAHVIGGLGDARPADRREPARRMAR